MSRRFGSIADGFDEKAVNAMVLGELGVESGGHDDSFTKQDGEAVAFGQHFDLWADLDDSWGADEDGFEVAAR